MSVTVRTPGGYLDLEDRAAFDRLDKTGKCGSCQFWNEYEGPVYGEKPFISLPEEDGKIGLIMRVEYLGSCHRYPPHWCDNGDSIDSWFPETHWHEWCGEYQPLSSEK